MSKLRNFYVTFGQRHRHVSNDGIVFDKDCVAIIRATTREDADYIRGVLFSRMYYHTYEDEFISSNSIQHYPRGFLRANIMEFWNEDILHHRRNMRL